jgi:hypothetical protein
MYDMVDVALEKATRFFYIAEASAAYSGVQRMEYLKRVQEQPMGEAGEKLWFKDYVQKKQLFEDTLKQVWAMTVKAKRKAEEGIKGEKPNFRFYALGEDKAIVIRSQILQKVREAVQYWTHDKQQLASRKKDQPTENSFTVNDYRHVVKQMGQDPLKYSEKRNEWRSSNPEQKLARSKSRKSIPFATMEKARDKESDDKEKAEKTELDNDEAVQVSQGGTDGVAAASKPESGSDTEVDDDAIQATLNKNKLKKRRSIANDEDDNGEDSSLDRKPAAKKQRNQH